MDTHSLHYHVATLSIIHLIRLIFLVVYFSQFTFFSYSYDSRTYSRNCTFLIASKRKTLDFAKGYRTPFPQIPKRSINIKTVRLPLISEIKTSFSANFLDPRNANHTLLSGILDIKSGKFRNNTYEVLYY
jgi:hypothetical protein